MRIRRIAVSAAFAASLAALPLATAEAQYYPPCSPFPLFWPFCVAGAIVGTAATIVTAPFVALTAPPTITAIMGGPITHRRPITRRDTTRRRLITGRADPAHAGPELAKYGGLIDARRFLQGRAPLAACSATSPMSSWASAGSRRTASIACSRSLVMPP